MGSKKRFRVMLVSVLTPLGCAAAEPGGAEAPADLEITFDPALNVLSEPDSPLASRLKRGAFADLARWASSRVVPHGVV